MSPIDDLIPSDIKRFILTSIDSVPHLEAMLLLRNNPDSEWDARALSERLFVSDKRAAELLRNLHDSGFIRPRISQRNLYDYYPISGELNELVGCLVEIYKKNLIEVTNLIHSKTKKQAQTFGDAFRFKEKEKDNNE